LPGWLAAGWAGRLFGCLRGGRARSGWVGALSSELGLGRRRGLMWCSLELGTQRLWWHACRASAPRTDRRRLQDAQRAVASSEACPCMHSVRTSGPGASSSRFSCGCVVPAQTAPLDLNSPSFYPTRKVIP
jgi:hypothetical protein